MPTASGLTVRHLAGSIRRPEVLLVDGTVTLTTAAGVVTVNVAPSTHAALPTVTVEPCDGATIEGRPFTAPTRWHAGAMLVVEDDAWLLDDRGDLPLLDDRPIHVTRIAPDVRTEPVTFTGHLLAAPWWPATAVGATILALGVHRAWWLLTVVAAAILVVTWWARHRHEQAETRRRDLERRRASARLGADLDRRHHQHLARARRRPNRPGEILLGVGDLPWAPTVAGIERAGWDPTPVLDSDWNLSGVPVRLEVGRDPIAIVGSTSASGAVVRSIVAQLVAAGVVDAVAAPPSAPWRWAVGAPGFTARPDRVARDRLLLLTETVPSARAAHRPEGPTIVVVPALDDLERRRFATTVDVEADGRALAKQGSTVLADGVLTRRLSEATILGLADRTLTDRTSTEPEDDTGRERGMLLFTAPSLTAANELLASLVIDLSRRSPAEGLRVHVVDAVDQPLVRLRQLPDVASYVSLDDDEAVAEMLERVAGASGPARHVLAVVDVGEADRHLRHRRVAAADTLLRLAAGADHRTLTVAGSRAADDAVDLPLAAAIGPSVQRLNGDAVVNDANGRRVISLPTPSARDLTAAVASLRTAAD